MAEDELEQEEAETPPDPAQEREDRLRQLGVEARRQRAQIAREDPNVFCEFVLRHELTKAEIKQGEVHRTWHRLANQHKRLVIWSAISMGKTQQLAIGRVLWELGRNPSLRIVVIGNTSGQAAKLVNALKLYLENSPELREVFPHLMPSEPWTSTELTVKRSTYAKDASIEAIGTFGPIKGARKDLVICDDILDGENTATHAQMEKVASWFHSSVLPQVGDEGRVIWIGNAWHPEDLAHRLAARQGWVARKFPVMDTAGNPTWPDEWSRERIRRVQEEDLTPLEFARQLMCQPYSEEEARFKQSWLTAAKQMGEGLTMVHDIAPENLPPGCGIFTGWDVSSGEAGDLSAAVTHLAFPNGQKRLLWVEAGFWLGPEIVARIIDHHQRYNGIQMVENSSSQYFVRQFTNEHSDASVLPFTTGRNKADPQFGFESLATEFYGRKWVIPSTNGRSDPEVEALLRDLMFYKKGKHVGDRGMAMWFSREAARRVMRTARPRHKRTKMLRTSQ